MGRCPSTPKQSAIRSDRRIRDGRVSAGRASGADRDCAIGRHHGRAVGRTERSSSTYPIIAVSNAWWPCPLRRLHAWCSGVRFTGVVDGIRADVWVHPAAQVRRSAIAGDGLFIDASVPAGTPLIRFGGTAVTTAELHELFDEADANGTYVDTIAIGPDCHVVLPAGSIAHYANHSCDPTMWLGAPLEFVARFDLEPGSELTSDYGVTSDDAAFEMPCRCGAAACRRVITGCDWQLEHLQHLHQGRWPAGLQARIDTSRASE